MDSNAMIIGLLIALLVLVYGCTCWYKRSATYSPPQYRQGYAPFPSVFEHATLKDQGAHVAANATRSGTGPDNFDHTYLNPQYTAQDTRLTNNFDEAKKDFDALLPPSAGLKDMSFLNQDPTRSGIVVSGRHLQSHDIRGTPEVEYKPMLWMNSPHVTSSPNHRAKPLGLGTL